MEHELHHKDLVFSEKALDLISNVLFRANSTDELAAYLTQEIGKLTGARCVLLVQYSDLAADGEYRVIGVNPSHIHEWAESAAMTPLYKSACQLQTSQVWDSVTGPTDIRSILSQNGLKVSVAVPLQVGGLKVGAILALGLPEEYLASEMDLLNTLSTSIALVFRNAFLYENQEHIIKERNADLQRSNKLLQIELAERKHAEEALRSSQQMLQLVLDTIPVRVFWKDRALNYLGGNREALRDAGLSDPKEIVGKNDYNLAWKGSAESYRADDAQVINSGVPKINFEERQIQSDGSILWLQTSKVPLRDAEGEIIGVLGTYEDVTERKQAEEALKESEERYRSISDGAFEGIFIHDKGVILDVNRAVSDMLGYEREELIGKNIYDYFAQGSRDIAIGQYSVQSPTPYEACMVMKDGMEVDVQIRGRIIMFKGKQVHFGTVQDITDQVRARERIAELAAKMEEEKTRLRTILDTLPVGVVIYNQNGGIVETNQMLTEILGGDLRPFETHKDNDLKGWWANTGIKVRTDEWAGAKAIGRGETTVGQVIDIKRLNGSRGTILDSGAPIGDAHGQIIGSVVVVQDITEQRKLEHEAIEAKERAGLYIDLLTHDINNLNTAAKGFLQLIADDDTLCAETRTKIEKSIAIIDDVANLIENVKKIQRIEATQATHELMDLGWVLEDVVSLRRESPNRTVTINYTPRLKCRVIANELLEDVFSNIIDNALKHSSGDVTIDIDLGSTFKNGMEYHRVSIEDNGPGIPEDMKSKVFSHLQRGKTKASGSGLGLYLVKRLVEDFHGSVWVEDRVLGDYTKGARFVVILPVARPFDESTMI